MSDGRTVCHCGAQVLKVRRPPGGHYVVDWPHAEHGDIAVEHTASGAWLGRYATVGEPLAVTEKRYQRHACQPPAPSISEPRVPAEVPAEQVQAWQQAVAAHNAKQRNRRGKRPAKPITGIRINPGGSK